MSDNRDQYGKHLREVVDQVRALPVTEQRSQALRALAGPPGGSPVDERMRAAYAAGQNAVLEEFEQLGIDADATETFVKVIVDEALFAFRDLAGGAMTFAPRRRQG